MYSPQGAWHISMQWSNSSQTFTSLSNIRSNVLFMNIFICLHNAFKTDKNINQHGQRCGTLYMWTFWFVEWITSSPSSAVVWSNSSTTVVRGESKREKNRMQWGNSLWNITGKRFLFSIFPFLRKLCYEDNIYYDIYLLIQAETICIVAWAKHK